jgi:hypothetical protein
MLDIYQPPTLCYHRPHGKRAHHREGGRFTDDGLLPIDAGTAAAR